MVCVTSGILDRVIVGHTDLQTLSRTIQILEAIQVLIELALLEFRSNTGSCVSFRGQECREVVCSCNTRFPSKALKCGSRKALFVAIYGHDANVVNISKARNGHIGNAISEINVRTFGNDFLDISILSVGFNSSILIGFFLDKVFCRCYLIVLYETDLNILVGIIFG